MSIQLPLTAEDEKHPSLKKPCSRLHRYLLPLLLAVPVTASLVLLSRSSDNVSYAAPGEPTLSLNKNACLQSGDAPTVLANRSSWVYDDAFKKVEVERFLGAIRIPTMSFDDMGQVDPDKDDYDQRWDIFPKFHSYLEETFPLIYSHPKIDLAKPAFYSLVYTFKGSDDSLKPLVLTAHFDVVPALTVLDRWTYPPFQGVYDGEYIYGRGASDCKNSLIAIMSALEHLIETGWAPKRTLVLAFGQDEEIGGPQGAFAIGPYLEKRFGTNGVAMLIDEGGAGVSEEYGRTFILPGTVEKGNVSPKITVDTLGGHSSTPAAHTSIGYLGRIVAAVEDAPLFPPKMNTASPIYGYLQCILTHGEPSLVPKWLDPKVSLNELARRFADVGGRAKEFLVRSSKAVTVINGGIKLNALPESASAIFNTRIDFAQTVDEVLDLYVSPIIPIASKFNLTLIHSNGSTLNEGDEGTVTLSITGQKGLNTSPSTPLEGKAWDVFTWASRRVYGDNVVVSPSASTGNTDTKHYWSLTKNIFRFVPRRQGVSNAHTVDEKTLFATHIEGVSWFYEVMLTFDDVEGNDF